MTNGIYYRGNSSHMKLIPALLMIFMTLPVGHAGELSKKSPPRDRARLFILAGNGSFVHGDTVPSRNIFARLYLDKKCDLPVADAKNMRYLYWTNQSVYRTGCWYPTLDDGYVMLYSNGETEKQPSWEMLPKSLLNADGSAEITDPGFDSSTIVQKVLNRRTEEMLERRRRGEY